MKAPRVFVLILTWNNKEDVLECLASVAKIHYPNFQTVLIDNDSADDTVIAIRQKFPNVKIIENNANMGYAEGNNVGIRYALKMGTDYIWILNNDLIVDTEALGFLVAAAEENPKAGIFCSKVYEYARPNIISFVGSTWMTDKGTFSDWASGQNDVGLHEEIKETDYANGCSFFLKSQVAKTVGFFDKRYFFAWEETDLCYRARRAGYLVMIQPKAKVWHKVSKSFEDGSKGWRWQYYDTRNRFLWIEKNLRGSAKLKAFKICLWRVYWGLVELWRRSLPQAQLDLIQVRLLGAWHYFIRRFGPAPLVFKPKIRSRYQI